MLMIFKRSLLSACLVLFASGCVAQPPKTTATDLACPPPIGQWLSPTLGHVLGTPDVLAQAKSADIVMLAETHTVSDHHRWQLQTVAQLYAARPDMVLGFESFPRRVQGVLDQWVDGTLSEKEFLEQSDWDQVWKFDASLYMPLFQFARLNRIPMLALNVDKSLTHKVSKLGWDNVSKADRLGIRNPTPPSDAYLKMLGQVFTLHAKGKDKSLKSLENDPNFISFAAVQVTWDVAMAEALTTRLHTAQKSGRSPQLVAIVGRGHLEYGYGVPHQLKAMGVSKVQVFSPWDQDRPCADLKNSSGTAIADAVFGLRASQDVAPVSGPKLGVMIHTAKDGGVVVGGVMDNSIAKTTGLLKGDIILQAAGQATLKSADLIAVVTSMSPGTWLPLTVKRGSKTLEFVARFPASSPKHNHP